MVTIHQMRGGAPDKFKLFHDDSINLIHHDFCNLVSYNDLELLDVKNKGEFILPADEKDIKRSNEITSDGDQSYIILPLTQSHRVIDYDSFVPKDSKVYSEMNDSMKYMQYTPFKSYTINEFIDMKSQIVGNPDKIAIKSATGSGSRGVWLVDKDRLHLGGKYVEVLTEAQFDEFVKFCRDENCTILLQELIPSDSSLLKCNTDFILNKGKLISYKWDIVNQSQQFTNWDTGTFVRNKYTDMVMNELTKYLVSLGVDTALMNFESFTDFIYPTYMVEFNWRYCNTDFEFQALGYDPLDGYLNGKEFMLPMDSELKFHRYWQCGLDIDNDQFINGK